MVQQRNNLFLSTNNSPTNQKQSFSRPVSPSLCIPIRLEWDEVRQHDFLAGFEPTTSRINIIKQTHRRKTDRKTLKYYSKKTGRNTHNKIRLENE